MDTPSLILDFKSQNVGLQLMITITMHAKRTHTHTHTYAHKHAHTHTHTHMVIHTRTHTHIHAHIRAYIPGTQPGFLMGGAQFLVTAPKGRSGVSPPENFWKTYGRLGALYCICCIIIINFVNFKVLFFSLLYLEKIFATVCKQTENQNSLLFVVELITSY